MFKYCSFLICLLLFCLNISAQNKDLKQQLDNIQELRLLSKNNELDIETQILYAERASKLSYKTEVDSIIFRSNKRLLEVYLKNRDFNKVKKLSYTNLKLAKKVKDSSAIAYSHYYIGELYRYCFIHDSAYYHYYEAKKLYKKRKDIYKIALVLYGMAVIQKNEKDLTGSESTSIEVISLLESIDETEEVKVYKSYTYNNLGLLFSQLKQYKKSIEYYNLSLEIKKGLESDNQRSIYESYNNLGNTFKHSGQYDKAIKMYTKVLGDKVFIKKNIRMHAIVLDNYAHALFLSKNHKQLPELYLKALRICNSINANYRPIIIHQHLADYYYDYNKKDSALYHGYKAKEISEQFYKDDLLKSLLVLSKIEEDSIAVKHYKSYINLNDSIQREERLRRNKYARIQFETDQHIKETKRLSTQNISISVIGGVLILVLGLLYFIKVQRSKNKTLLFAREQEKANQEIYKLMLQQQTRQEEGRLQERHRIAEDLHDGILSRLFGTRMSMGFLDIKGDKETLDKYKCYIEEMQDIEREIRDVSHALKKETKLSKTSFESIIEEYIENQSIIGYFEYKIVKGDSVNFELLNESIRVEVYRIIQEAVQNILKHAQAEVVTISFLLKERVLGINIKDDGIGFDANRSYKGIGLKNITSRVLKLGGDYKITSIPNKGTELNISIPI